MDTLEQFRDVIGDLAESISDVVTDVSENVADFSREALEHFDEAGIRELNAGNWKGALDHSDFADKEGLKDVANAFHLDKNMIMAGTKVIGGALGAVAALTTPGFQMMGVTAAGTCAAGICDFKKIWNSSREAKALSEYGAAVS